MRPQNSIANMFGVGAGMLLGLNICAMRNSTTSSNPSSAQLEVE
jgi:hypothetical protein